MKIRFQPEAEVELAEARLWYSLQREGLVWPSCSALTKR